jgi:arylsulfatase A-like enzyme
MCLTAFSLAAKEPVRPTIVVFLVDDLGIGDVAALSASCRIRTPYLDGLATEGMRLRDFHSNSAVCTPTRYGLLTGRYAWRTRLQKGVLQGDSPPLIAQGRPTLASMLREGGYRTAMVGKWHLGLRWAKDAEGRHDFSLPFAEGPLSHGFESFLGIAASADMPPYVFLEGDRAKVAPTASFTSDFGPKRTGAASPGWTSEAIQDVLIRRAIDELRKCVQDPRPLFLLVSLASPHTPVAPAKEWVGRSGINRYADFVMQMDHDIGRVLMALRESGRAEDALVVFTSDNGCSPEAGFEELAKHDHFPSARFRGAKSDLFEGGHRVPCLVRWPGRIARGSSSEALSGMTDWYATLAEVAGLGRPSQGGEDSVSLVPVLTGKTDMPVRDHYVMHSIDGSFALRVGTMKYLAAPGSGGWSEPNGKTKGFSRLPPAQLYDLAVDPREEENLAAERAGQIAWMRQQLIAIVAAGRSTPGPASANDVPVRVGGE